MSITGDDEPGAGGLGGGEDHIVIGVGEDGGGAEGQVLPIAWIRSKASRPETMGMP